DRGDKLTIVDVREPNEYQINRIGGSRLIPLGDIPKRYDELNRNEEIVVQCKMGGRSAKAADFLRSVGFTRVLNLKGGILDWIDKVDPTQPKYSLVTGGWGVGLGQQKSLRSRKSLVPSPQLSAIIGLDRSDFG